MQTVDYKPFTGNDKRLAAALLIRSGIEPLSDGAISSDDMDRAWPLRDMDLPELCSFANASLGDQHSGADKPTQVRAAVASGAVSNIMGAVFGAALIGSYRSSPDSTRGWVAERDVARFGSQDRMRINEVEDLDRHARGGPANMAKLEESDVETLTVARFTKSIAFDEMDIVNDRLDALLESGRSLGRAALRLKLDLIYAKLLANGNMTDGNALFHANHANTSTGALALGTLQTTCALLAAQRENGIALNLKPAFVIVQEDQKLDAANLLASGIAKLAGLTLRSDSRINATGVTDPSDGVVYLGDSTRYYIASRAADAPSIESAYIRGSGRAPVVRAWSEDGDGRYGVGLSVVHDLGVGVVGYRGLAFSTGA